MSTLFGRGRRSPEAIIPGFMQWPGLRPRTSGSYRSLMSTGYVDQPSKPGRRQCQGEMCCGERDGFVE